MSKKQYGIPPDGYSRYDGSPHVNDIFAKGLDPPKYSKT